MDSTLVKLLEKSELAIGFLVTKIQDISPDLWAMTRQKILVRAVTDIGIGIFLFLICFIIYLSAKSYTHGEKRQKLINLHNDSEDVPVIIMIISSVCALIVFVVGCIIGIESAAKLMSIDYYTLQELIYLVK
ncbi:MAG TPA: hypothetical protein ENH82_11385 [bacterium]|nr:hypothetical protein [bacterium]